MGTIDPEAASKLQPELLSGESLLWAGRPNPSVLFHSDDWYLIPFSLFWVGFTAVWESLALGYWGKNEGNPSLFLGLWGIPFILIGQYLTLGSICLRWLDQAPNLLRRYIQTNCDRTRGMEPQNHFQLYRCSSYD
jgi:hypothetical protein